MSDAPMLESGSPAASHLPPLTLTLFGYPSLVCHGAVVTNLATAKTLALLVYLAMEGEREQNRETLATLLWPAADRSTGLASLRQTLHRLRQALPASVPLLQISRRSVALDPAVDLQLDVDAFTALLATCEVHAHRRLDACGACIARLEEAAALYQGDFLAGFSLPDSEAFTTWQAGHQEALHGRMLAALAALAAYRMRRQEYGQAIDHLQRALALAPWQEESHRQLMRALALDGQRAAALNQFETCRRLLAEELDIDPSPETMALRDRIEAGLLEREQMEAGNPYRGLFAFDEQHADDFYGRERLVQHLLDAVKREPLLAVVGPSGSGKSSLLHAGLLPRLHAQDRGTDSPPAASDQDETRPSWTIVDVWPGNDPFASLAETAAPLLSPPQDDETLAEALRQGEYSLDSLAEALADPTGRVLFLIDQFEELYTLCPDATTREAFLNLLLPPRADQPETQDAPATAHEHAPLITSPQSPIPTPPFTVLLVLRADFMGQALAHRPLADALQQGGTMVGPMNRDELRRAVEEPSRNRGVRFESGLVERLLGDVGGEPGYLPLLQFCLTQLWGFQQAGTLTHAAYDDIGGLAGALSRYAEHSFERLSDDQKAVARRTLTRLVQPGEATVDTRRWASRRELGEAGWRLVQQLADARLVVTDTAQDQEQAALAHEALIQHWERLHVWLEQDQARRLFEHRLLPFLRRWEATDRDPGELLRGALLAEAEELARSEGVKMSDREHGYVQASIAARDEDQARLERRRQSELEQAHALAEAEYREAEIANRSRRRLRWMAAGLAAILVLALLAAWIAVGQSRMAENNASAAVSAKATAVANASVAAAAQATAESNAAMAKTEGDCAERETARAEAQAQLALSRQLGAQAISLADEELDTALLLSLESLRISSSAADRRALHADLAVPPFLSTILQGPSEPIYYLGADAEDVTLLSAGERGLFVRWDLASGQAFSVTLPVVNASDTDSNEPRGFVSPDGRLAGETRGSGLTLWDTDRGEALFSAPDAHAGEIGELLQPMADAC